MSARSPVFPPSMEGETCLFWNVTQASAGGDSAVRECSLIKLGLIIHSVRATWALSCFIQWTQPANCSRLLPRRATHSLFSLPPTSDSFPHLISSSSATFNLLLSLISLLFCSGAGGPAEGAEDRLPGNRGPHSAHPPEQQAGLPGADLQALEVEEKEKWEAQAELHRYDAGGLAFYRDTHACAPAHTHAHWNFSSFDISIRIERDNEGASKEVLQFNMTAMWMKSLGYDLY